MKQIGLGILLLLLSGTCFAEKRPVELGMQLQGEIRVDSQGKVVGHAIKDAEKVPEAVRRFVDASVRSWVFAPPVVEGRSVELANTMSLLVVARPQEDGGYKLRIQAATFDPVDPKAGYEVTSNELSPPGLPKKLPARMYGDVRVYLVLKVGRDGRVEDAFAEQVNLLTTDGDPWGASEMRDIFGQASAETARRWTFFPPTRGAQANAAYWTVRIPVTYRAGSVPPVEFGRWEPYWPGPRKTADWVDAGLVADSPEAMLDGQLRTAGGSSALQLQTPVAGVAGDG